MRTREAVRFAITYECTDFFVLHRVSDLAETVVAFLRVGCERCNC